CHVLVSIVLHMFWTVERPGQHEVSVLFELRHSFHDAPTTDLYTLSLHDALPILRKVLDGIGAVGLLLQRVLGVRRGVPELDRPRDRKSTRLNSSHVAISYAVFCLKKKT